MNNLRADQDALRDAALGRIEAERDRIAAARGVAIDMRATYEAPAVTCDADLQSVLAAAIESCGIVPRRLASGAGHDAMVMGALGPVGMLFTRCRGGISHTPAESITAEDAALSALVLCRALEILGTRLA